jgi:hypothetical protein
VWGAWGLYALEEAEAWAQRSSISMLLESSAATRAKLGQLGGSRVFKDYSKAATLCCRAHAEKAHTLDLCPQFWKCGTVCCVHAHTDTHTRRALTTHHRAIDAPRCICRARRARTRICRGLKRPPRLCPARQRAESPQFRATDGSLKCGHTFIAVCFQGDATDV